MKQALDYVHALVMNMDNYQSALISTGIKVGFNKWVKKRKELSETDDKTKGVKSYLDWVSFLEFLQSEIFTNLWINSELRSKINCAFKNNSIALVRFVTIYLFKTLVLNKFKLPKSIKTMKLASVFDTYVDVMIVYNTKLFAMPIVEQVEKSVKMMN